MLDNGTGETAFFFLALPPSHQSIIHLLNFKIMENSQTKNIQEEVSGIMNQYILSQFRSEKEMKTAHPKFLGGNYL
jgi:hypothetical protein